MLATALFRDIMKLESNIILFLPFFFNNFLKCFSVWVCARFLKSKFNSILVSEFQDLTL